MNPQILLQLQSVAQSLMSAGRGKGKNIDPELAAKTAVRIVGHTSLLGVLFQLIGGALLVVIGLVVSALLGLPALKGTAAIVLLYALTRRDVLIVSSAKAKIALVTSMFKSAIDAAPALPPSQQRMDLDDLIAGIQAKLNEVPGVTGVKVTSVEQGPQKPDANKSTTEV